MKKRIALTFAAMAAVTALAAPAAHAGPPPITYCGYAPDLDGHLYAFCITVPLP